MAGLKWKRGRDWPNSGDEFMVAESPQGRFTIKRIIRNRVDPWYELHLDGRYVSADWVMKKLKAKAASGDMTWTF